MKKMTRRPFSREMLLPLPVRQVNALALEYHLALSVLALGRGGLDQVARLAQALCHARRLAGAGSEEAGALSLAEAVLDAIATRAEADEAWSVMPAEHATIARALAICDRLLAREPYHCFATVWTAMLHGVSQMACMESGSNRHNEATP